MRAGGASHPVAGSARTSGHQVNPLRIPFCPRSHLHGPQGSGNSPERPATIDFVEGPPPFLPLTPPLLNLFLAPPLHHPRLPFTPLDCSSTPIPIRHVAHVRLSPIAISHPAPCLSIADIRVPRRWMPLHRSCPSAPANSSTRSNRPSIPTQYYYASQDARLDCPTSHQCPDGAAGS